MSKESFLKEVNKGWYYRFLGRRSAELGTTANQRPLEVDCAKWATSRNVGDWYQLVADNLVALKLAHWNPAFDPNATLGGGSATLGVGRATEMIIIDKPDRVLSFDETRVELDMTKSRDGLY